MFCLEESNLFFQKTKPQETLHFLSLPHIYPFLYFASLQERERKREKKKKIKKIHEQDQQQGSEMLLTQLGFGFSALVLLLILLSCVQL